MTQNDKVFVLEVGKGNKPPIAVFVGTRVIAIDLARRWVTTLALRCNESLLEEYATWRRLNESDGYVYAQIRPFRLGGEALFKEALGDLEIAREIRKQVLKRKIWRRKR